MKIDEITIQPEPVDEDRLERSRQTIQALKTDPRFAPFRDRIRVFGSLAGGKTNPGDIDILVDLGLNPAPKGTGEGMSALLELLKQYGRLDPFVYGYSRNLGKEVLWCAYGDFIRPQWTIAKNARAILKAGRAGMPLSEIKIESLYVLTGQAWIEPCSSTPKYWDSR
jgi:predicted nucleotidyltransferase